MRLVMMGTGTFAEPVFRAMLAGRHPVVGLVTNPDRPSGREPDAVGPMKQIALQHGIPVFQPENVNAPDGVAGVAAFKPELLVVADYGQILSADALNAAPMGGINVHGSLLPKYRGAAPIAWAIYHGEKQTGVTIIRMSTKLDAGDMLAREAIDILPDDTAGTLKERLAPIGAKLAQAVIEQIEAGTTMGIKQDTAQVTKAPKLKKEHGLIDWTRTAEQVCCQVRAMQPWPTAYTFWHRPEQPPYRLIVIKAVTLPAEKALPPGTVANVTKDSLAVAAGNGWVSLVKVQPAGKRVMEVAEFLRGHRVQVGESFGPEVISDQKS
jgi:methionyl-tRNA formyltransferase